MATADKPPKYVCITCGKQVTSTKNQRYRTHTDGTGENCAMSSEPIPPRELEAGDATGKDPGVPEEGRDFATCPACGRGVKLTSQGYYEHHTTTLRGEERCEKAGTRYQRAAAPTGPSDTDPKPDASSAGAASPSGGSATAEPRESGAPSSPSPSPDPVEPEGLWAGEEELTPAPESRYQQPSSLPTDSVEDDESGTPGLPGMPSGSSGPTLTPWGDSSGRYRQPEVPYLQPVEYSTPVRVEMEGHAATLAARIRETFYAYSNRDTADNRTAQKTMGPSEIGTPCDRRIALNLMGAEAVNPGGDGWAAFVGTCTHEGMADIYRWASAGTGRYAVEARLKFDSVEVPYGTSDLFDRAEGDAIDWKIMGKYSLDKFKREGPTDLYRTQIHVYGRGQELKGEKVSRVAVVGLPRASAELSDMHVWSEPYDRSVAEEAFNRVRRINARLRGLRPSGEFDENHEKLIVAREFEVGSDCKYCPFHRKSDKEMSEGCPGV